MRVRPAQTYATIQCNRVGLLALYRKTKLWAGSSVGERCVRIAEVGGSNPPRSTNPVLAQPLLTMGRTRAYPTGIFVPRPTKVELTTGVVQLKVETTGTFPGR